MPGFFMPKKSRNSGAKKNLLPSGNKFFNHPYNYVKTHLWIRTINYRQFVIQV